MIEKQVDSLLSQRIIKNQNEPKILVIGAIDDKTSQNIDIEIVTTEIMKHLSNSGKFVIVNAGSNANIEKMIRNARKFRDDAEYNQYTTIEQGNLISPNYALTGKITERTKSVGDDEIKEYVFVFKLTDLMRGAVRWVSTERISKKLAKSEVENFQESKSYNSSYSYTPSYSQKDDEPSAWEKFKEFFSADGKNYFVLGFDLGLGGVGINLTSAHFTIDSMKYRMWIDDYYSTPFAMPLNVRVGYLRDIGDNWAFGINFLYNYMYVSSFSGYELKGIREDNQKLTHTIQRIGGELLVYYKALDWLHIYVGGGVLKDFSSKYKLSFDTYNKQVKLEQKIDSWYPLVKVGILWDFHSYIGAISDITCSWAVKEENYLGTHCALVLGLQLKI